jgi:anoctamin-10
VLTLLSHFVVHSWHFVATKLTNYENHPCQTEYETSLTVKTFALSFFAAYGESPLVATCIFP